MSTHKFNVGDKVRISQTTERRTDDVFTIVRLMPGEREDLPPAYRIKSASEGHERMAKQDELQKVGS